MKTEDIVIAVPISPEQGMAFLLTQELTRAVTAQMVTRPAITDAERRTISRRIAELALLSASALTRSNPFPSEAEMAEAINEGARAIVSSVLGAPVLN